MEVLHTANAVSNNNPAAEVLNFCSGRMKTGKRELQSGTLGCAGHGVAM